MRIQKVRVQGFRLLEDVEIMLEPGSTVIVGRNNSGKTSLTDVFERFAGDGGGHQVPPPTRFPKRDSSPSPSFREPQRATPIAMNTDRTSRN